MRRWIPLVLMVATLVPSAGGFSRAAVTGDQLVLRDTGVAGLYVLGDAIVYRRYGLPGHKNTRPWMRRVHGRTSRAFGVPRGARAGAIGRDGSGRIVLTMWIDRVAGRTFLGREWWLYDVAGDRSRRLLEVPTGQCSPTAVSIWRTRLAYATDCDSRSAAGVFLRSTGRTRRLLGGTSEFQPLALRGDMLAGVMDAGDGDSVVWRLMEDGKLCRSEVGDSYLPEEWRSRGVWFSGHTLIWWSASGASGDGWLTGTRLPGRCAPLGATGAVEPAFALPPKSHVLAVDGRWLYYADAQAIRRQPLPAPRTAPPPNDNFEAATPLTGDPPLSLTVTIGNATTQPGDPTTDTVWYAFTPSTTQWVQIGPFYEYSAAIFQGADLRSLTQLKPPTIVDYDDGPAFDAIGGQTYFIAVGCHVYYSFTCYMPLAFNVSAVKPPAMPATRGAKLLRAHTRDPQHLIVTEHGSVNPASRGTP